MDFQALAESLGLDWKLFVFQLINALVVLFVLKRYAFGPIMKVVDERYQFAEDAQTKMSQAEDALKNSSIESEKVLSEAKQKYKDIVADGVKVGTTKQESLIKEALLMAEQEKNTILSQAEAQAQKIRKEAQTELRDAVILGAQKLVRHSVSEESMGINADKLLQTK